MFINLYAQDVMVTGKVTSSEDGSGIPGVSVVVKGTSAGTTTDADGNFRISVPSSGTLLFSSVGFKATEVAIQGRTVVDIQLASDVKQLTEVVVTGYGGAIERRAMTGATSSVSGKQIQNLPLQSFDKALQGRASGVQVTGLSGQPGGAINVRIRGIGSINAGTDPLYIIDGVQEQVVLFLLSLLQTFWDL
jgi:TonB-dependent starch-binding outer membrane protein SusC